MKDPLFYEILCEIGRGGMASVHEAMHLPLRRRVAIKVMLPHLAADPTSVARFEREARLASSVRHPHIVEIFDFGDVDGVPFLAMELLAGETLAARLACGKAMAVEEAVAFVLPIASAVAHAHTMGIVHRDLKPANVFLTEGIARRPWPKILDFGISKQTSVEIEASMREGLTGAASMVGTLSYMAPEQIEDAGAVTAKTDQYALAVMLYECITGRLPFFGANPYQLMHSILNGSVTAPSALVPELPDHLDQILLRALERDPKDRHPSVNAFASLLLGYGGRETCAQWTSEFAGGQETAGRTQNGNSPPSPSVASHSHGALRQRNGRRRRVAVTAGIVTSLVLLGLLGLSTRLRAPRLAPTDEPSVVRLNEPSVIVAAIAVPPVVPVGAPREATKTATAETHKPASQQPTLPRERVSASKRGEAPSVDSRESKPANATRPASAETQPPTRPRVGTNEAPIFE